MSGYNWSKQSKNEKVITSLPSLASPNSGSSVFTAQKSVFGFFSEVSGSKLTVSSGNSAQSFDIPNDAKVYVLENGQSNSVKLSNLIKGDELELTVMESSTSTKVVEIKVKR